MAKKRKSYHKTIQNIIDDPAGGHITRYYDSDKNYVKGGIRVWEVKPLGDDMYALYHHGRGLCLWMSDNGVDRYDHVFMAGVKWFKLTARERTAVLKTGLDPWELGW